MGIHKTSFEDIHALRDWVRFMAARADLGVEFKPDIKGPYTSKDMIVIPTPVPNSMTQNDHIKLRNYVVHEVSHHIYGPKVFDISEENALEQGHPLQAIFNISEDGRIERCAARAYRGDAVTLSAGRRIICEEQAAEISSIIRSKFGNDINNVPEEGLKLLAVSVVEQDARSDWDVGSVIGMETLMPVFDKSTVVNKWAAALRGIRYAERLRACADEYESWALAKEVYDLLYKDEGKSSESEIDKMKKAKAEKGEGGESEGTECEAGDVYGGGDKEQTVRVIAKLLVGSDHRPASNKPITTNQLGLDYTGFEWGKQHTYTPQDNINVTDFSSPVPSYGGSDRRSYEANIQACVRKCSAGFPEQVRRLIQVRAAVTYQGGYKSGKIRPRVLYRRNLPPEVVSEDYRQRLFRRKVENDVLDVAISLLVDCSGSMGGEKYIHAVTSASILAHALDKVLHIPVEILGHTTGANQLSMAVVKPFGRPYKEGECGARFAEFASRMNGNADADAIWFTYKRLLKQKNKRKILVVLSDGSPTDGASGTNPSYALKHTVAEIHEAKRAEIYGVGIQDENVKYFYPRYVNINDPSELETKLLTLLRDRILSNNG